MLRRLIYEKRSNTISTALSFDWQMWSTRPLCRVKCGFPCLLLSVNACRDAVLQTPTGRPPWWTVRAAVNRTHVAIKEEAIWKRLRDVWYRFWFNVQNKHVWHVFYMISASNLWLEIYRFINLSNRVVTSSIRKKIFNSWTYLEFIENILKDCWQRMFTQETFTFTFLIMRKLTLQ